MKKKGKGADMKIKMFDSSAISYAKRDNDKLTISFTSGKKYEYNGVPAEVIDGFWNAESAGNYFYKNIRGQYNTQKVENSAFKC